MMHLFYKIKKNNHSKIFSFSTSPSLPLSLPPFLSLSLSLSPF